MASSIGAPSTSGFESHASGTGAGGAGAEDYSPGKLMELAERLYTSFKPERVTVDTHVGEVMAEWRIPEGDARVFLSQVFYGCVRFRRLLSVFTSAFFFHNAGSVLRSDVYMYTVYAYVTLLRLEELGFAQFRRLVLAQDPQKMLAFLAFVFSEEQLAGSCRDEWLKLYDRDWVDGLIAGVFAQLPKVSELVEALEQKVYLSKKKEEEEAAAWAAGSGGGATTKVVPFKLSVSKPRPLPPPDDIPPAPKPKPVPPRREGPTREQLALEQARVENRQRLKEKYADPSKQPFRLKVLERPNNLDKIAAEVTMTRDAELTFAPAPAKPVPRAPVAEVKLNAAAILREDALYKRKQEQEARMLRAYEEELRDGSEFKAWQDRMRQQDEEERLREIEERRAEMAASEEAAHLAREAKLAENRVVASAQRVQTKALEEKRELELKLQVEANRQKREQVVDARAGVEHAKESVAVEKKERAVERVRERQEASRQVAEEKELEHQRKMDLVRQLRALEKVPTQRVDEFDSTSTPGHGLLEEMSLAELRERIATAKARAAQEEENRRQDILKKKVEQQSTLQAKVQNISRVRDLAAAQAATRKEAKVKAEAESKKADRERADAGQLELHARLEEKRAALRAEQRRLQAEQKEIKFRQEQQAANAGKVEETKFRELRKGAERALVHKQATAQVESRTYEQVKEKAQKVRNHNVAERLKAKDEFIARYDEKIALLAELDALSKQEEYERKKALVETEHTRVQTLREDRERNTVKISAPSA